MQSMVTGIIDPSGASATWRGYNLGLSNIFTKESTNSEYRFQGNQPKLQNAFNYKKVVATGVHGTPFDQQNDDNYWQSKQLLPNIRRPIGNGIKNALMINEGVYNINPIAGTNSFGGSQITKSSGLNPTNYSLVNTSDIDDRLRANAVPKNDPLSAQYAQGLTTGDKLDPNNIEGDAQLNNFTNDNSIARNAKTQLLDKNLINPENPFYNSFEYAKKQADYLHGLTETEIQNGYVNRRRLDLARQNAEFDMDENEYDGSEDGGVSSYGGDGSGGPPSGGSDGGGGGGSSGGGGRKSSSGSSASSGDFGSTRSKWDKLSSVGSGSMEKNYGRKRANARSYASRSDASLYRNAADTKSVGLTPFDTLTTLSGKQEHIGSKPGARSVVSNNNFLVANADPTPIQNNVQPTVLQIEPAPYTIHGSFGQRVQHAVVDGVFGVAREAFADFVEVIPEKGLALTDIIIPAEDMDTGTAPPKYSLSYEPVPEPAPPPNYGEDMDEIEEKRKLNVLRQVAHEIMRTHNTPIAQQISRELMALDTAFPDMSTETTVEVISQIFEVLENPSEIVDKAIANTSNLYDNTNASKDAILKPLRTGKKSVGKPKRSTLALQLNDAAQNADSIHSLQNVYTPNGANLGDIYDSSTGTYKKPKAGGKKASGGMKVTKNTSINKKEELSDDDNFGLSSKDMLSSEDIKALDQLTQLRDFTDEEVHKGSGDVDHFDEHVKIINNIKGMEVVRYDSVEPGLVGSKSKRNRDDLNSDDGFRPDSGKDSIQRGGERNNNPYTSTTIAIRASPLQHDNNRTKTSNVLAKDSNVTEKEEQKRLIANELDAELVSIAETVRKIPIQKSGPIMLAGRIQPSGKKQKAISEYSEGTHRAIPELRAMTAQIIGHMDQQNVYKGIASISNAIKALARSGIEGSFQGLEDFVKTLQIAIANSPGSEVSNKDLLKIFEKATNYGLEKQRIKALAKKTGMDPAGIIDSYLKKTPLFEATIRSDEHGRDYDVFFPKRKEDYEIEKQKGGRVGPNYHRVSGYYFGPSKHYEEGRNLGSSKLKYGRK